MWSVIGEGVGLYRDGGHEGGMAILGRPVRGGVASLT